MFTFFIIIIIIIIRAGRCGVRQRGAAAGRGRNSDREAGAES
jgi:hypothetical protein